MAIIVTCADITDFSSARELNRSPKEILKMSLFFQKKKKLPASEDSAPRLPAIGGFSPTPRLSLAPVCDVYLGFTPFPHLKKILVTRLIYTFRRSMTID